jgi:hypothetical protein
MYGGSEARIRNFGHTPPRPRLLRGHIRGKFGRASKVRKLSADECRAVEDQMRREGRLSK